MIKSKFMAQLTRLPGKWHSGGNLAPDQIDRIYDLLAQTKCECTAETGCGKSTLVLSQLSAKHICFTTDWGTSLATTKSSNLLRTEAVEFVIGSTQATLPKYQFSAPLDFALIDGPHGYPFPDLEYYYFYPKLRRGGILALDDTHIPTIRNIYNFLREEIMFTYLGSIRNLAFFERNDAPTFSPLADGWYEQNYNLNHIEDKKTLDALYGEAWWDKKEANKIPKRIDK